MKMYINFKSVYGVETIEEMNYNTTEERKETRQLLHEYNLSDNYNHYYLSQRSCKEWRENNGKNY